MKRYVYSMICFMLLVTGCSNKNISRNVDLNEAVEETITETITETSAETVVFDQYATDNEEGESDCADILETLPSVMEGKWLITEGVHLRAVERIEESLEGTVIEFSKEAIRVNGEALINPTISRDEEMSYDSLIDTRLWVGKIGMQDGDFARRFTVKGWLDSCNSEYYIPILYFDGKPHFMSGCDYGMEKLYDTSKARQGTVENADKSIAELSFKIDSQNPDLLCYYREDISMVNEITSSKSFTIYSSKYDVNGDGNLDCGIWVSTSQRFWWNGNRCIN